MSALTPNDSCDRCVASYQVTVFHPARPGFPLRFCKHHHEQAADALMMEGWLTVTGSAADAFADVAQMIG